MKQLDIAVLVLFVALSAPLHRAAAYQEPTHQLITQLALRASKAQDIVAQLSFGAQRSLDDAVLNRTFIEWAELGADREDAFQRPLNHFHNPLTAWTVAGLGVGQSSALWLQNADQEWSWTRVRDHLYDTLTKPILSEREQALTRVFRGIGHLVHLAQDAASPAHTRNDAHPFGYQYEKFVLEAQEREPTFIAENLATPVVPDPSWRSLPPNPFGPLPAALLLDAEHYLAAGSHSGLNPDVTASQPVGLAEYTNANFLSEDSLWGHVGSFKYPARSSTIEVDREIRLPSGELVTRRYYQKVADGDSGYLLATVGLLRDYYMRYGLDPTRANHTAALDEMIYRDYARKLLPRALGYSIALIDAFFDSFLRAGDFQIALAHWIDGISPPDRIIIGNLLPSGKDMEGRFELYRMEANGQQQQVATWSLKLQPLTYTAPFIFPLLPYDPTVSCRLVFRGRVGQEQDVVAVSKHEEFCPMADPPPPPPPVCIPFCD